MEDLRNDRLEELCVKLIKNALFNEIVDDCTR